MAGPTGRVERRAEPSLLPGVTMRGCVWFTADDRVAAVALYRRSRSESGLAVAAPWIAEIKTFAVPPAGWVMP